MDALAKIPPAEEPPEAPCAIIDVGLEAGASDWHFRPDEPCRYRIRGKLVRLDPTLVAEKPLRELARYAKLTAKKKDASFAYRGDYFRLHAYSAGGDFCLNLRRIPGKIPELAGLRPPPAFEKVALASLRGLILITGPAGSGKSTTLAAAIDHRNRNNAELIITLEDPIEFRHENRRSLVRQREKGRDFDTFAKAVNEVMRGDLDVLLVGEMRDPETIAATLTAAETGHLVFATLHCATARDAISRIVDACPADRAGEVRTRLAKALVAVLAQQLIPTRKGELTAAFELLLSTPAVRNLISDPGHKYDLVANEISTGNAHGMIAFDQSLEDLVRRNLVDREEARRAAINPASFDSRF